MIVDRYYYHQLNTSEQAVYRAFYAGVMAHQDVIPLPVKGTLPQSTFERIYRALTLDNPLIYFLNQSACSIATDSCGHLAICPQYFWDEKTVHQYNRKIETYIQNLAAQLQLTAVSDYEKEKRIHDWFCQNVTYDTEGSSTESLKRAIVSHNIIGVFRWQRGQCEGIAKAVKVLLNAVDVKCIVVTGIGEDQNGKEPHAWNIVKLDEVPYQLDVTWDLCQRGSKKGLSYDYFNLNDQLMSRNHKAEMTMPVCNSLEQNYFAKQRKVFRIKYTLMRYIGSELAKGKREFYFRYEGRSQMDKLSQTVVKDAVEQLTQQTGQGVKVSMSTDEKVRTCWVRFESISV